MSLSLLLLPFTSTAVRYMVNYDPLPTEDASIAPKLADIESGETPAVVQPTDRRFSSLWKFFGIGGAIFQVEGIGGLYKGLVPSLLTAYFIPFLCLILNVLYRSPYLGYATVIYMAPTPFYVQISYHNMLTAMLLYIPGLIITYRAISTPHRLPWFSRKPWHTVKESLHALLTPDEQRKPWLLFLTPGLLFAQLLHLAILFLITPYFRTLIIPKDTPFDAHLFWRVPALGILLILATVIRAPLQVMITRLVVQGMPVMMERPSQPDVVLPVADSASPAVRDDQSDKQGTGVGDGIVEADDPKSSKVTEVQLEISVPSPEGDTSSSEPSFHFLGDVSPPIIRLRPRGAPYLGLIDCFQTIRREEGVGALYRLWWISLLFVVWDI